MVQYRYLAFDLRTNVPIAELPLSDVSYGAVLNGVGALDATLPLVAGGASPAASTPERTIIFVERNGVLIDGYIIWARQRSAKVDAPYAAKIRNSCYGEDRNYISIPNLPLAGSATLTCTIYQQSGGAVNLNSAWLNMTWKGP